MITWKRDFDKSWRGQSPKFGPVKITRGKTGSWYLQTDPWTGSGVILGHYETREKAQKAAE